MADPFKVSERDAIRVADEALRATTAEIFRKMGVPDEDCDLAADVLLTANLRGVDTHGVANLLRAFVKTYRDGSVNPRPNWRILRETPSTANIDSDRGLGVIVAPKAMEIAIDKAKNTGVGIVTIRNSRTLGMASYHAMMALRHDMIGMCTTSCPPQVVPPFGAEPRLGTNPIALAAPADKEPPFVFDAAMSAVAGNRIKIAQRLGRNLLPGWVADEDGTPIMKEVPPPTGESLTEAGVKMLPLGSIPELGSHKGYGLAAIVDILGGIMSGGGYGLRPGRPNYGHYVAAYSIEAFMDTAQFKQTMDEWLRTLRSTPPAPGHERVLYPGLPEAEMEADRRANGIPLHPEVMQWFRDICGELSIPFTLDDS